MVFTKLSSELQKLVEKRFKQPTLTQEMALPPILAGMNTMVIAQTGTGKTESAMLPVFNFIIEQKTKPISALYVTPLKSLNRDLLDRLLWWGEKTGVEISVRHGDTSQHERKMQLEFPPHLMICTLETLQPVLTAKRFREHLRNVKWVILDEVHEIADSKRGVQLSVALERLKELCGDFQLIMLSATVGEPEKVANFFAGGKIVKIVKADTEKKTEIKVVNPKPQKTDEKIAEKIFTSKETAARLRTIMELIKISKSTLAFTNTREFAEILSSRIKTIDKNFPVAIHHSSLSKDVRIKAEKDFKEEKLKALIATSSLQLGIDIGSVDLVLQYMSPRQVTQLIQRVGRSGHDLSRVSKGIVVSTEDDDIFESAVIARKSLAEELEPLRFHENSSDVLAHQLIGLTFDFGRIELEKAYNIVKRAYPYRNLSYAEFLEVCKQLERIGLAFLNGTLSKKRRGFEYYFTQLSTIPDVKQYRVLNSVENSFIGVLDEEFIALHGEPGTTFILKGEPYRIISVEGDRVIAEPSTDTEAAIPGWEGDLIPVPYDVAQEVGQIRRTIFESLKNKKENEIISELQKKYPIDENCAKKMVSLMKRQKKFGEIPDEKKILVESFENTLVLHACYGTNVNETLGRFLAAMLTSRVGSVGLKVDPYRIILQFLDRPRREILEDVIFSTNPAHLQNYIELSLAKTELFEWKFVHVAKRFGAIARGAEYGKFTLKKIIQDFAGTPLYKEALRELETEKLDIPKTVEILKRIQKKEIPIIFAVGLSPIAKAGFKQGLAEVIGPERPEAEIFERFKKRILSTKLRMICINCGKWSQVFKVEKIPESLKCGNCGAMTLASARHDNTEILKIAKKGAGKKTLSGEEIRKFEILKKKADLFLVYKKKAAIVMSGHGVGPTTAKRILAKYHRSVDELIRDVMEAERQFLKTRRFWSA